MSAINSIRMDKASLTVSPLKDETNDKEYWLSKTPLERLAALEILRQINYGYDPATTRLQRVLEVVERQPR